jgi:hypothetical protein
MIECYTSVTFGATFTYIHVGVVLLCTIYWYILHICRPNGKPEMSHKKKKWVAKYSVTPVVTLDNNHPTFI